MASFASAGLRPAWNRGRPASSRSSSESSRATSRSRSRTQDAWGGDRASTDKSTDPPLLEIPPGGHRKLLPWNNKDPALEARFAYWTQQKEAGPAELFAAAYKSIIKTQAKEDAAMCYNEITGIWERKDFDEWMIWFQRWCRDELQHLADDVDTASRFSEGDPVSIGEDGEKIILAAKKAWVAAQRTITATIDHLGKRAGMVSGAKLAAVHLRDDKFFRSLDSARNGVSFANGIVNLCDGSLTPRIANLDIPWSYALDYDYDPRADQTDIRAYIHSLFDDLESEHTMQVHAGYMFTGNTTYKGFYQFAAPSYHGKSAFLQILKNAMGPLASMGEVPVAEFGRHTNFETTLGTVLKRRPPVRVIICDECNSKTDLNEQLINQVTSGLANIQVPCRMKGTAASVPSLLHAKLVFATNHELVIDSASTGTMNRLTGPPFPFQFVPPDKYDPDTALPHQRIQDLDLVDRLSSPEARPGIVAWLVEGAIEFFRDGFPRSSAWESQAFELRTRGDMFAQWITQTYTPTGMPHDRVALSDMRSAFADSHKHFKGDIESGLTAALATMTTFVVPAEWPVHAPVYNPGPFSPPPSSVPMHGYTGLRIRAYGDRDWKTAMQMAVAVAEERRRKQ